MKIKRWHVWLGFLISIIFLYLAFRKVDYSQVWSTLKNAQWIYVLVGLFFYFIGVLMRTWRWQILLNPLKVIDFKYLFSVICIGYMGNNVYPARAGEVLRSILLKRREEVPISASLATIVVERLFDGITILALVLLNLNQLSRIAPDALWMARIETIAGWVSILFGIILLTFLLLVLFPAPTGKILDWLITHLLPKSLRTAAGDIFGKFINGLVVLRSVPQTLLVFVLSMLVWVAEAGLYWGVMQSLGLDLNFLSLLLIEGVVNLVLLIPAAPGGLGTFDAATKNMLELFKLGSEAALGYALVLRVALWLPITVLGLYYFVKEGFRLTTDFEKMNEILSQDSEGKSKKMLENGELKDE